MKPDDTQQSESVSAASACSTAIGASGFECLDYGKMIMAQTRERLTHGNNMARAIADFAPAVLLESLNLQRLLNLQEAIGQTPESQAVVEYIVERIQKHYRDNFGTELGQ